MRRHELSHRERVRLALEHKETDRVPIAMVCSGINAPAHKALEAWLARERGTTVDAYLEPLIDIKGVGPDYIGPALPNGTDMWGVHRSPVSYGPDAYMEIDHYPLGGARSIDDLLAHRWPSADWFDYSVLPRRIAQAQSGGEYCLMLANGNIFESSWYMRGFERMLMDLAANPELAHAIFERVTEFFVAHFTKALAAAKGQIDLVFTADDIGGQNGLLMSLPMWKEHLQPYHRRLNRVIHEFGAKVIYHSDGAVMEAVPGLIEMGIDVLQALQFDAKGMDPVALKRNYGDVLCFEGGVSVQRTLPFGTPEAVRAEVCRLIDVLGRGGGYILGPAHAIQAGTPPENIVALFDTAAAHRRKQT
jgi:uroporphyrinogen decarboxylase